jgi:hypothetical protein
MDLPMDKAKLLKQYDLEKKWDIICDQVSRLEIKVFVHFLSSRFFEIAAGIYILQYLQPLFL